MHGLVNWDDLRYFLAIARAGTLAGAARELRVEHTTVGRRLSALEQALGTKLFTRGPDGFALTRAGHAVLPLAKEMDAHAEAIPRRVAHEDDRIEGTVRLTTSEAVSGYFVRQLGVLKGRHPALMVEVLSGNRAFDLMRGEADLAIRIRGDSEPDLLVRKVGRAAWSLYASPAYVERKGALTAPDQLSGHEVVGFDATLSAVPGATWLAEHAKDAVCVLRANSIVAAMNATIVGMGVGILPCFLGDAEASLRRLTPVAIGTRDILLVAHPDLAKVARVRAVMDYVVEVITRDARMWDGTGGASAKP